MLIKIPFIQYLYWIKSMRQTIKEIEADRLTHGKKPLKKKDDDQPPSSGGTGKDKNSMPKKFQKM